MQFGKKVSQREAQRREAGGREAEDSCIGGAAFRRGVVGVCVVVGGATHFILPLTETFS